MAAGAIRAGKAFVELGVSDRLTSGLRAAEARLRAFGASVGAVGQQLAKIGGAALAPLGLAAQQFVAAAEPLQKMAIRTGIAVESLSELSYAAAISGTDIESLELGIRTMQRTLADAGAGAKGATASFARLGLSVADLVRLTPDQQLAAVGERLSRITDPAMRAAAAVDLFGRTGTRLLPMLQDGAAGLDRMRREAATWGLTISTGAATSAAAMDDAMTLLRRVVGSAANAIGEALAPTITDLAKRAAAVVAVAAKWIRENKELVVTVAKIAAAVTAGGVALIAIGAAITAVGAIIGGVVSVVGMLGAAFGVVVAVIKLALSPLALLVAGAMALTGVWRHIADASTDALGWIGRNIAWLKDRLSEVTNGIINALRSGNIQLAAEIMWASLEVTWAKGIMSLTSLLEGLKNRAIKIGAQMWYGLLSAAEIAISEIKLLGNKIAEVTEKGSVGFRSWMHIIGEATDQFATATFLRVFAWMDDVDFEFARDLLQEQTDDRMLRALGTADEAAREIEQRRGLKRRLIESLRDATLAEIGQAYEDAISQSSADAAAAIAVATQRMDAARERLRRALEQAATTQPADDDRGGVGRRPIPDPYSDIGDRLRAMTDAIADRITTIGTFQATTLELLGTSGTASRIERNTAEIARHTQRLTEAATTGRLTFAPDG